MQLAVAVLVALTPMRVTVDGVAGVQPGMTPAQVSARWGVPVHPTYEVRPTCGEDEFALGSVVFTPRDRFGAVFFRRRAVTGRGIRIGSTRADVVRAYGKLPSRRNRFTGGRDYFVRGRTAELRLDVSPGGRVTQIAFGTHGAVRLDEGCA
jgi:hypothetical protein